jgi:hypothetical protein
LLAIFIIFMDNKSENELILSQELSRLSEENAQLKKELEAVQLNFIASTSQKNRMTLDFFDNYILTAIIYFCIGLLIGLWLHRL